MSSHYSKMFYLGFVLALEGLLFRPLLSPSCAVVSASYFHIRYTILSCKKRKNSGASPRYFLFNILNYFHIGNNSCNAFVINSRANAEGFFPLCLASVDSLLKVSSSMRIRIVRVYFALLPLSPIYNTSIIKKKYKKVEKKT